MRRVHRVPALVVGEDDDEVRLGRLAGLDRARLRRPLDAIQLVAHAVPLHVREHGAHVDEHHQLALELAAARIVEALGNPQHLLAVELRAVERGAKGDGLLLHLAAKIDQLGGGVAEHVLQAVLLLRRKAQKVDDFRAAPPLAGREVDLRQRGRCDEHQQRGQRDFPGHSFLPLFSGTHDSHSTTAWKSCSSSFCQGSTINSGAASTCAWIAGTS